MLASPSASELTTRFSVFNFSTVEGSASSKSYSAISAAVKILLANLAECISRGKVSNI